MAENMLDYLRWRGDLTPEASPLCSVDFLILSELAHCPLENLARFSVLAEAPLYKLDSIIYPVRPSGDEKSLLCERYRLWIKALHTERFRSFVLSDFSSRNDSEEQIQFAAVFFRYRNTGVIAFRGTDATLVGWHEDLRLGFESPIPAQKKAVEFVTSHASQVEELYLCGHSKGGNLAMYSAVHAPDSIRKKIKAVYNYDGPGLDDASLESEAWREMEPNIHSYLPESSVVGKLLGYQTHYSVIVSDDVSVKQHNPFHWHVLGPGFVLTKNSTLSSRYTDQSLHTFLKNCDTETRKILINTVFEILEATGATKLSEIGPGLVLHMDEVIAAVRNVPPENRAKIAEGIKIMLGSFGSNVPMLITNLLLR